METQSAGAHTARPAVAPARVEPGADVPKAKGAAGLGGRLEDVGRPLFTHHPPELKPLAVEPGEGQAEKADHR